MKHTAKLLTVALAFCLMSSFPAVALDDTPENRAAQADIYMHVRPPQSALNDITDKLAATLPANLRTIFHEMMTKNLDMTVVNDVTRNAMIKNFTADELKGLADFYGSPVGRSTMAKMGTYMTDVMTPMMAEVKKALAITQEQMKAK